MSINCGNCKNGHETVADVKACFSGSKTNTVKVDRTAPVKVARPFKQVGRKAWEPIVTPVTFESYEVRENSTGTETIKIVFKQTVNNRPVTCKFTVAGGMLSVLDAMICRFVGYVPSEVTDVTLDDYMKFVQSMVGQSFNAYVFEDGILKCTPNSWKPIA